MYAHYAVNRGKKANEINYFIYSPLTEFFFLSRFAHYCKLLTVENLAFNQRGVHMAIAVRLKCSECSTIRPVSLNTETKEIVCPVCGRRIQNLTDAEHSEIEGTQKKQLIFSIISLVFFGLAMVCLFLFMGDTWTYKAASKTVTAPPEANVGFFIGTLVCGVVAAVIGAIGSAKRFVVEF